MEWLDNEELDERELREIFLCSSGADEQPRRFVELLFGYRKEMDLRSAGTGSISGALWVGATFLPFALSGGGAGESEEDGDGEEELRRRKSEDLVPLTLSW